MAYVRGSSTVDIAGKSSPLSVGIVGGRVVRVYQVVMRVHQIIGPSQSSRTDVMGEATSGQRRINPFLKGFGIASSTFDTFDCESGGCLEFFNVVNLPDRIFDDTRIDSSAPKLVDDDAARRPGSG